MKILITSGGTKIPLDSVRHIGNMSSGTMGREIALAALEKKHEVGVISQIRKLDNVK